MSLSQMRKILLVVRRQEDGVEHGSLLMTSIGITILVLIIQQVSEVLKCLTLKYIDVTDISLLMELINLL